MHCNSSILFSIVYYFIIVRAHSPVFCNILLLLVWAHGFVQLGGKIWTLKSASYCLHYKQPHDSREWMLLLTKRNFFDVTLSQLNVNQDLQIHSTFQFYYVTFPFSFIKVTHSACTFTACLFLISGLYIMAFIFSWLRFLHQKSGLCILYTTGFHMHSHVAEGNHGPSGIAVLKSEWARGFWVWEMPSQECGGGLACCLVRDGLGGVFI